MEKLSISSFKNDSSLQKILHDSSLSLGISGGTFPVKFTRSSYYDVTIHPRIVFFKCVLMKNQNRIKWDFFTTSWWWPVIHEAIRLVEIIQWVESFEKSTPPISHRHRFPPIEISLPPLIILRNDELEKIMYFELGTPCRENFWHWNVCPSIKIWNGQAKTNPTP